jgi:glutamate synthase (NADPH/NADH) small chain
VAVVGSGPAGLTAAADLAKMGHSVTIFESSAYAGGVLMYGILSSALPKEIVQNEVNFCRLTGSKDRVDSVVGKLATVDELLNDGFDVVFLGTGAGLPMFLNVLGKPERCLFGQ